MLWTHDCWSGWWRNSWSFARASWKIYAEFTRVILSISLFITHYWFFKSKSQYFWIVRVHPRESTRKRRPQRPRENGNFQLRERVSIGTQNSGTFSPPIEKTCISVCILPSFSSAELLNLFGEVSPKSSSSFYAVYKLWKIWVCFRIIFNVQPRC